MAHLRMIRAFMSPGVSRNETRDGHMGAFGVLLALTLIGLALWVAYGH